MWRSDFRALETSHDHDEFKTTQNLETPDDRASQQTMMLLCILTHSRKPIRRQTPLATLIFAH
jgi:hypothetical protein